MKPLQVLPTRAPSLLQRWLALREERTPMGGRVIHLGSPASATVWLLAVAATAPMLLVGMVSMV